MSNTIFNYDKTALDYLSKKDKVLAELIKKYGIIQPQTNKNIFEAIITNILAQQISNKALETVYNRFKCLIKKEITPKNVLKYSPEELKTCGISLKKAIWIREFAEKVFNQELNLDELKTLEDFEIIQKLISLNGIGTWTAEMLLIFTFERKNIININDFGIKKALKILYKTEDIKKIKEIIKNYSPYSTIASFYLWQFANEN